MTAPELLKSLSDEQAKAFNAALVEMRDGVNAARDANEQTLAAAHAEILTAKDSEVAKLQSAQKEHEGKAALDKTAADDAVGALKTALVAAQDNLAALQSQVTSGIATIRDIIADPDTDTEKGLVAFLHNATKDERTRQREALEAQKAELEKQLAEL